MRNAEAALIFKLHQFFKAVIAMALGDLKHPFEDAIVALHGQVQGW